MHRQPRVRNKKARRVNHHRFTGITRRFPRNGFNGLLRALPGDRALLPPSFVDRLTSLTPASGRQDHTTSPSAASIVRLIDTTASTASRPAFVTIAKRPSVGTGHTIDTSDLGFGKKRNIFRSRAGQVFAASAEIA